MMGECVQPVPPAASTVVQQMGELTADARQPQGTIRRTRRTQVSATRRRPVSTAFTARQPEPASAARGPDVLTKVAGIATMVLGSEVGHDQPLMAAGLDSLGAVELRNALAAAFGTELPPTVTLDYPTVAALAAHIAASSFDSSVAVPAAATEDGEEEDGLHAEVWIVTSCLCSVLVIMLNIRQGCVQCSGLTRLRYDQQSWQRSDTDSRNTDSIERSCHQAAPSLRRDDMTFYVVQAEDDEFDGNALDPSDAVGLADHLSSTFGAGLPPDLQDALAAFLDSQRDSDGGDAAVLVSTITDSSEAVGQRSAQAPRSVLPAVLATAAGIVGGVLTAEQPLMDAGLDSLGALFVSARIACTHDCHSPIPWRNKAVGCNRITFDAALFCGLQSHQVRCSIV